MRTVLSSLLLLIAPVAGQTGWRDLTGEPIPELHVGEWLNADTDRVDRQTLEGKVWLLEFFATWCLPSMRRIGDLSALHQKYYDRGFRVVAVSAEPLEDLRRTCVTQQRAVHWLGSDPANLTLQQFVHNGDVSTPQFYLVDASGRVAASQLPTEAQIESLLDAASDPKLDRVLRPELAAAREDYERGAIGVAWRTASLLTSDPVAAVADDALWLRDKIEHHAALRLRTAGRDLTTYNPDAAYAMLLELRWQLDGLDAATWAAARLEALRKDAKVKALRLAWSKLDEALRRDVNSNGQAYERKRVVELYTAVVERHAGSAPARVAQRHLTRLGAGK